MASLGITFFVLLMIGVPVAFTLGWSAFVFAWFRGGVTLMAIPLQMFSGVDKFVFMAIPLFMLAGELMVHTGILERLLKFNSLLFGKFRGSLAQVTILASMIFAGISGSAVADASALGAILIPAMRRNYNNEFGAGIVAGASTIGPIIPPSIPMIIYAMSVENVSIGGLFLSGVIPGVLIGLGMMVIAYVQAVRNRFPPSDEEFSAKALLSAFINVLPALFMPVIILGGILGGIFTATEAAAIAVLYALLIGVFVTKSLQLSDLWKALLNSGKISSMVFLVIATASVVGWMLTEAQLPQIVSAKLKAVSSSPLIFLVLLNVFLLIVGCVLEPASAMVMLMPIISPIATSFGIHSLHLGIIVVLNLTIGLITPPVGTCLFVACGIAKLPMEKVVRSMWPHLVWQICVLLLVTYIPKVALVIPFWFGIG
ncbi:MAG: TRAP transporter large permease [Deltaproteobacteria bacterium]|nr:TRAP transporter large permease [Deltaproteobacteria bacterium]MBW2307962.1 TRAP transporter large permease [Deltaproteobacteria bacterium]